jgi:hypothetical protein
VSFVTITLCVVSQGVFIVVVVVVYFVIDSSGNFWIHPRMYVCMYVCMYVRTYVYKLGHRVSVANGRE